VKKSFTGIGPVKFINIGSQNLFKVLLPIGKNKSQPLIQAVYFNRKIE